MAVVLAGTIAAAALYLHYRKKKQAARAEVASTATRATRGADERAGQGDGGGVGEGPPLAVVLAGTSLMPTVALAEEVVPMGLPVAASDINEEMVTVVTGGSWAPAYPASGGSWAPGPASEGGAAADSGAGLVVVTGLVLPNESCDNPGVIFTVHLAAKFRSHLGS